MTVARKLWAEIFVLMPAASRPALDHHAHVGLRPGFSSGQLAVPHGREHWSGGLSGPAIKPIALRLVYQAARAVKIPVVGLGGIATGEDAAEFLIAGASAVQVGTATFWDPASPLRIARELADFCSHERIAKVSDLVGTLLLP